MLKQYYIAVNAEVPADLTPLEITRWVNAALNQDGTAEAQVFDSVPQMIQEMVDRRGVFSSSFDAIEKKVTDLREWIQRLRAR